MHCTFCFSSRVISPEFIVKSTCQELQLLLYLSVREGEQLGEMTALPAPKVHLLCEGPTPDIQHPYLGEAALSFHRELQHKMKWFGAFILNPPQSHWTCVCPGALVLLFVECLRDQTKRAGLASILHSLY